ncbi:hypothetical protein Tco_1115408 [Tanacetum coccineum]
MSLSPLSINPAPPSLFRPPENLPARQPPPHDAPNPISTTPPTGHPISGHLTSGHSTCHRAYHTTIFVSSTPQPPTPTHHPRETNHTTPSLSSRRNNHHHHRDLHLAASPPSTTMAVVAATATPPPPDKCTYGAFGIRKHPKGACGLISAHQSYFSNLKKCLSDESLVIPMKEFRLDDKLNFVEEPVEIMDREVKQLKQSCIPIVKVIWISKRGP